MGIDPSLLQEVFGLFYKVNKKAEGIRAGLTIVNRIIEANGRIIRIESERGKVRLYVFGCHQKIKNKGNTRSK